MQVTIYTRPSGESRKVVIQNIRKEDQDFFESNGIAVSMEMVTEDNIIVYGAIPDFGEDEEVIVFSHGKTCEETMSELRAECQRMMEIFG